MKKGLVIVVLIVAATASTAGADLIGLFADQYGIDCSRDFPLYAVTDVSVVAILPYIPAITAAEFRIEGVEQNPAGVIITRSWNSPLTIGDPLGDGFSIAFTVPQPGPIVPLGVIQFFVIDMNWPGTDVEWCVVQTLDSGKLVLIDDNFAEHDAEGWCFVANCTIGGPFGQCECLDSIPTRESNWGELKAMY